VKALVRLLLVASILYGTGAHWAALQGAAWAKMALSGAKGPCEVCRLVERGQAVRQVPSLKAVPSVEMSFVSVPALVNAVLPRISFVEHSSPFVSSVAAVPPPPPPKTLPS
jgi:hypothetical protein